MEHIIIDPSVPYFGSIPNGKFTPGNFIKIQGNTPGIAYRFDIYLKSIPQNDNILQLSVRILDGYIAINSLENGIPGEEQLGETLPIKRAQGFEILILCDTDKYKIVINGQHFCDFLQRIHYSRVTHLTIDGDVSIIKISYEASTSTMVPSCIPSAPTLLPSALDDFEIIDSNRGFCQPPPYSEIVPSTKLFNTNRPALGLNISIPYTLDEPPMGSPEGTTPLIPSGLEEAPVPVTAPNRPEKAPVYMGRLTVFLFFFFNVIVGVGILTAVVFVKVHKHMP